MSSQANHYIIHTAQYESGEAMVEMFDRGQIVLPKYVRDRLKLKKGTQFSVDIEGQKIILEPQNSWLEEFHKLAAEADMSDEEVRHAILECREKRRKAMLDVPGR